MNVVEMRTVGKVRFVILDLASMHALFSNVLHLQLVLLQFMTSDVHACLDTQETGEIFATEVSCECFASAFASCFIRVFQVVKMRYRSLVSYLFGSKVHTS